MAGQDPTVLSISASLLAAQRATGWCLQPAWSLSPPGAGSAGVLERAPRRGRLPVQYAVSKAHKQSRAAGQTWRMRRTVPATCSFITRHPSSLGEITGERGPRPPVQGRTRVPGTRSSHPNHPRRRPLTRRPCLTRRGAAARRGRASLAATTGRFLASSIGTPIEPRNVNRRSDDLRVKAGLDWLRLHACGTYARRSCWLRAYQRGRSGRCLTTARLRSR